MTVDKQSRESAGHKVPDSISLDAVLGVAAQSIISGESELGRLAQRILWRDVDLGWIPADSADSRHIQT